MPFLKKIDSKNATLGLWEITENEQELLGLSQLTEEEKNTLALIRHEKKRKEFLAGRLSIKNLMENAAKPYTGLYKDDFGKPHLNNCNFHISLSHSYPLAGAILNTTTSTGLDIEKIQEKLVLISHKYLSLKELNDAGQNHKKLCIYWCAKEALYKKYGRKQVIFSKNLIVMPFLLESEGVIEGWINMPDLEEQVNLQYFQIEDQIICYIL